LKLIDAFFNLHFGTLLRMPFSSARFFLDDGGEIALDKTQSELPLEKGETPLVLTICGRSGNIQYEPFRYSRAGLRELNFPVDIIDREIPELERVERLSWLHLPSGRVIGLEEVLDLYGTQLPQLSR